MMKINPAAILLVYLAIGSCRPSGNAHTFSTSGKTTLHLIELCVDSILSLDKGLNTGKYSIDFSPVKQLNRQGIDSFFKLRPYVTETNADSLVLHDSTWIKYQFFQNPVIRINKIEVQEDGTLLINGSKCKSSDGAIGVEIVLLKNGENYICLSSKITWIS